MKRSKRFKFEYDPETDAAYLTLSRGKVKESEEVQPGVIIDFGAAGRIIGVEILRLASRFVRQPRTHKKLAG